MEAFERLRLVCDPVPNGAAYNMALDEALLSLSGQEPLLRVYQWARPSVSFGYFEAAQPVLEAYPERVAVRRWTGGGVVLHGEDWTYSLIVPRAHPFMKVRPAESYRLLHAWLAEALGGAGGISLAGEEARKISQACFENAVRHDLVAEGRKIAGAAQRRSRAGLLHQGSVLGATLPGDLAGRLAARLSKQVFLCPPTEQEQALAREMEAARYGQAAWLSKR